MPKFSLRRVRLNNGGYNNMGHYYGRGAPLYEFDNDATPCRGDEGGTVRASDRAHAKRQILAIYPDARFYR